MPNNGTLRDKITLGLLKGVDAQPDPKSNKGRHLWPIYYWQIVGEVAKKNLGESWNAASMDGVVGSDDEMRALGEGEHIVADSSTFSALASVTKPRMLFDRDLFIAKLVKKYKLEKSKLEALAEECKTQSKAALTKRVVEV